MTISKRIRILLIAATFGLLGLEVGEQVSIPGLPSAIPVAEAVVGRPATPVSVAGVARRTVRRCAVGVVC